MKKKSIIKGWVVIVVVFASTILAGYLNAATNDARILSNAEMQAFVGSYTYNCKCATPKGDCQECLPSTKSGYDSMQYNSGSTWYGCIDGSEEQECYTTSHECGTAEQGGEWSFWEDDPMWDCSGDADKTQPGGMGISNAAIGTPCPT